MNLKFVLIFITTLFLSSCYNKPNTYDEITELFNSKQWTLDYVSEDVGKGPIRYNDNYNTSTFFFYPDKTSIIKINGNVFTGTWDLEEIKGNYILHINIPEVEYISRGWVVTDIYRWGYDQTRVIVKSFNFDRDVNMEMGLN